MNYFLFLFAILFFNLLCISQNFIGARIDGIPSNLIKQVEGVSGEKGEAWCLLQV